MWLIRKKRTSNTVHTQKHTLYWSIQYVQTTSLNPHMMKWAVNKCQMVVVIKNLVGIITTIVLDVCLLQKDCGNFV